MDLIKIEIMRKDLTSRYDYIEKLEGIRFLKTLYGDLVSLKECKKAYELAYQD